VELRDEVLLIVNTLRRHRVPLAEIDRFEIGRNYLGITMYRNDGTRLVIHGVQKPNIAHWLRRRTKADEIVDELNEVVRKVGRSK
jgi:hypothetical protein